MDKNEQDKLLTHCAAMQLMLETLISDLQAIDSDDCKHEA